MPSRSVYLFGPFRLHVARRLLLHGDTPVGIGSRAFDLLASLLAHAGEVVSPATLMATVWPDTVVEPNSLRVHISALRKALGPAPAGAYVQNIPTRGYSFVAPVQAISDDLAAAGPAAPLPPPGAAPPAADGALDSAHDAPPLLGRADLVRAAAGKLAQARCLSLVGPPGIGKTSIALHVRSLAARALGVASVLLDLAPLVSADHLPSRLAASLGVGLDPRDPLASLAAALQGRPLLVLDNCEHLVGPVAALLEQLLQRNAQLRVLVTSQEPLRIRGESVMRVPALDLPPADWAGDGDARRFAAVALFLQRADECNDGYTLQPGDAATVGAICRRLDGVPLAIELAAASTPAFSLRHIAEHLDQRLSLLVHGRRTAPPRHRTLRAAIGWSYDLLGPDEQQVLQALSSFSSWFTLEDAAAVCLPALVAGDADAPSLVATIHSLVSKSLLVVGGSAAADGYRLLESVRAFGMDRLRAAGQADAVAQRHARHLLARLNLPEDMREGMTRAEWVGRFGGQLDDLRAALAWAAGTPGGAGGAGTAGDAGLAVALTAASVPLWLSMGWLGEFLGHAERAAGLLDAGAPAAQLDRMRLYTALGLARWHVHGATPQVRAAFDKAGQLAADAGNLAYQLRALWGQALTRNANADYAGSLQLAARFGALIGPAPSAPLAVTHGLMTMLAEHLVGRHAAAEAQARRVLQVPSTVAFVGTGSGTQFDPGIAALALLGRLHWVRGRADLARACCDEVVERARNLDHAVSLCFAVAVCTAPVAHWAGDFARARRDCALMVQLAARDALRFWLGYGEAYLAAAQVREGSRPWDAAARQELARGAALSAMLGHTLCTFAPQFAPDDLHPLLAAGPDSWCAPELLRLQALRLLEPASEGGQGGQGVDQDARHDRAVQLLDDAIALAQRQQALAWELRSATTLAEALAHPHAGQARRAARRLQARDRLQQLIAQVAAGGETTDLIAARASLRAADAALVRSPAPD